MLKLADLNPIVTVFATHNQSIPSQLPPPSHGRIKTMRGYSSNRVGRARW